MRRKQRMRLQFDGGGWAESKSEVTLLGASTEQRRG